MEDRQPIEAFSLLGGPLHRLGCRLGLVRGATNTLPLGLAIGSLLWAVTILLLILQGRVGNTFSLEVIGGHLRLLVVIPLLFLAESWIDPRMSAFVRTLVQSGAVSRDVVPAMRSAVARTARRKDSRIPDAVCLAMAVLIPLIAPWLNSGGRTSAYDPNTTAGPLGMADLWYLMVCMTAFRFLMFRWVWRLALWSGFLWRVAHMELRLIPTHPDGTAGLGYLEVVHAHFSPLVMAISVVQAASLAEGISSGIIAFEQILPALGVVLITDTVLFLGPLLIFTRKLWTCRVEGLAEYMEFSQHYVSGFHAKWLGEKAAPGEPLLGTSDIQSLADLNNSVNIISNMRVVPVSSRLLIDFTIAAALPLLPLLLFKYPAVELIQTLLTKLVGL